MLTKNLIEKKLINSEDKVNGIAVLSARSLGEYLFIVDAVTTIWREKLHARKDDTKRFYPGELAPWFRGVSDSTYRLQPTLIRFVAEEVFTSTKLREKHRHDYDKEFDDLRSILKVEEYLLQRFKSFGSPLFGNRLPENEIGWNFVLRHHRAPSRLLDWSKGSLVALHFAIGKKYNRMSDVKEAAVWILEPRRLAELTTKTRRILGVNKDSDKEHISMFHGGPKEKDPEKKYINEAGEEVPMTKHMNNYYPLPIIPNLFSPRIATHIGRFTLHTIEQAKKPDGGFEDFAMTAANKDEGMCYLVKVVIPMEQREQREEMVRMLRMTGIADINFSQDLDDLANELKLRVSLGTYAKPDS
jgi:hypothetical protein